MALYSTLKSAYRTAIPEWLRGLSANKKYPLHYLFSPIKQALQRFADHDEIYDETYFAYELEPRIKLSVEIVADSIIREFQPNSVIDVGCGTGELLLVLKRHDVVVLGFERAEAALKIARFKGVEVVQLDLEQPIDHLEIRRADLVTSTEVAEHLPEVFADTFVEYLCRLADTVVLTAATRGQGGTDHVNEQPHDYWIAKFQSRNFSYDSEMTLRLRHEWEEAKVVNFYRDNLMIFHRSGKDC